MEQTASRALLAACFMMVSTFAYFSILKMEADYAVLYSMRLNYSKPL
jgi:hypothetical protein